MHAPLIIAENNFPQALWEIILLQYYYITLHKQFSGLEMKDQSPLVFYLVNSG